VGGYAPLSAGYRFNHQQLRVLRLRVPWTIDELAEAAHLHYTSVYNYEKGLVVPRVPAIRRLALALNVDAHELMMIDTDGDSDTHAARVSIQEGTDERTTL
jgi:transcriptional regulator with XRE-family HTH domain